MIKLFLVSNKDLSNIASFLNSKGAFDVPYKYENMTEALKQTENQIIKVDKLLYVCPDDIQLVRSDMQSLHSILSNNAFFQVSEVVFVYSEGVDPMMLQYFNTIMSKQSGINSYTKNVGKELTFDSIYNVLLNRSSEQNVDNVIMHVYKVERGVTATTAYDYLEDPDKVILPYDLGHLEEHRNHLEGLQPFYNEENIEAAAVTRAYTNMDAPALSDHSKATCICVTGAGMSGKSVWSSVLTLSMYAANKSVLLADMTKNADVYSIISTVSASYNVIDVKDLGKEPDEDPTGISILSIGADDALLLVNKVLTASKKYDYLLILCETDFYEETQKYLCYDKTLYLTHLYLTEVEKCASLYSNTTIVALADDAAQFNAVPVSTLKEKLGSAKIIGSKHFDNLVLSSDFYRKVLGITNE